MKPALLHDYRSGMRALLTKLAGIKREFAWVIAGQAIAFIGALIGVKLLTNMMPQEAYGQLALGLSISGLINMFLFGPLGQIILRYYSVSDERGEHAAYSTLLRRLHGKVVLVVSLMGLGASVVVQLTAGFAWACLTVMAVFFGIVSGLLGSVQALFGAARERKLTTVSQFSDVWLRFLLAALLLVVASQEGYWALAGYVLGSLCVLVFQLKHLHRMMPYIKEAKVVPPEMMDYYKKEFRQFGAPFVAFASFAVISQYADRWLLQGLVGAEAVGIYAVLYQISSAPIALLAGVVNQLIIPVVFARAGALTQDSQIERSRRLLISTQIGMAVMFAVAIVVAALWGKLLVTWLTNESYAMYADALWIMVLSLALFHFAQFMAAEGLSRNQSKLYFWPKLVQSLTLLIAGYFWVIVYGVMGMALSLLAASVVHLILVALFNTRLRRRTEAHAAIN